MIYGDKEYQPGQVKMPDASAIGQSNSLYSFGLNNPILYTDTTGEIGIIAIIVIGALIGALVNVGFNLYNQIQNGATWDSVDWKSLGISFVAGFLSGAIAASPIGTLGQVVLQGILTGAENVLQNVLHGDEINWGQVALETGITALAGAFGGKGATAGVTTTYGKVVNASNQYFKVVYLKYTSNQAAMAAAKAMYYGSFKGTVQMFVTDKTIEIIYQ